MKIFVDQSSANWKTNKIFIDCWGFEELPHVLNRETQTISHPLTYKIPITGLNSCNLQALYVLRGNYYDYLCDYLKNE